MNGTALPSVAAALTHKSAGSIANSVRIAAVADRLTTHLQFGSASNPTEFFSLCLSLARGIDYAVANNEVPPNVQNLPLLLKEICQRGNDLFLRAAIMVLLISAKNACKFGWFISKDAEEISALANEISTSFCSQEDITTALSDSLSVVEVIMSRFYPLLKMGHILTSLEVKPGYGTYVVDFHISKNVSHSQQEKIRLFVAQMDNTETSACLINPQQVNFLLNGKGVERRTNVLMDTGPQIPTNVTSMLKYGTNLMQAVGQFSGNYIVVVAFMSVIPIPSDPVLQDYVQSNIIVSDPDSDIIEGPSRVSLNCPISHTRIKTPVKGHSCKHLQCFDFRNYVDINSRRPSWRCPHCNQHVCYTDLRIDQNMVKVLKEVGEDVADVIISDDGSWKAVFQSDTHKDSNYQKGMPEQQEPDLSSPISPAVMDLTDDDGIDLDTSHILDKKPSPTTLGSQPVDSNLTVQSLLDNAATVDQDDFWATLDPDIGSGTISAGFGAQPFNTMPELPSRSFMTSPMISHGLSNPLSPDGGSQGYDNLVSPMQQWQQMVDNIRHGWTSEVPRNISRNPPGFQAPPAAQTLNAQRARTHLNTVSQAPNASNVNSNTVSQQHTFRSHVAPPRSTLPLHHQSSAQTTSRLHTTQVAGPFRESPGFNSESQNINQQYNRRMHIRTPSPGITQSSSPRTQQQVVHGTRQPPLVPVQLDSSRASGTMNSNPIGVRTPLTAQRANAGVAQQASPRANNFGDLSAEDWRPTGRMRGSITSQAAAAYGDTVIQATTQSAQSTQPQVQPQPGSSPLLPNVPANLQAFLANSRARIYATQAQTSPMGQPGSTNGGSGASL